MNTPKKHEEFDEEINEFNEEDEELVADNTIYFIKLPVVSFDS